MDWPHPETLLDAIDHWRLFMECWLEQSQVLVGRFEDYKADAPALLSRIVQALPFESSTADITAAAERSSYAAAAAAEGAIGRIIPTMSRSRTVPAWSASGRALTNCGR